ncbi:MAG TPA: UDP-N-acetylmuramate dehydrogenase [Deltaproteobacteria bacterium]|jgi:UDP-N-acetylmuramate: L-alanyl-gamma-D-glutamyl-meso-diaminopimelate ligase|nr:UDP-N-acetylmuramate dehydrogenase [Deltaproteobacteria bacterium]
MTPGHVHFIAIAGTGMGSLAGLLKARGIKVTGSDENLYPPMSTALERWGISVFQGFAPEHLQGDRPDLIVIGNAVRPTNPEAQAALQSGVRCLSFPDALHELAIAGKHSVVVAGTHGKTTTTSLVATLLLETGRDPSLLVGGIAENFGGSFREGKGPHFVVEGDEYDTAFFDKTPKFLHYGARTAVITSVEFDHADIYRDLDHVKEAFRALLARMPKDGTLVAAIDHAGVRDVIEKPPCRIIPYGVDEPGKSGKGPRTGLRASALEVTPEGTRFRIARDGTPQGTALVPLDGRHNVENAVAALAVVEALGVPLGEAIAALPAFRGVKRRQEVRGQARGIVVLDDFAHHPTAVRETVAAVRARYTGHRLVAVFEPRTNTSRRKVFQADYAAAFQGADLVVVAAVPDVPLYSATGEVTERFSAEELARDLSRRGTPARAIEGTDAIVEWLCGELVPGDVVLAMSNGAFGGFWDKLLSRLGGDRPAQ